MASLPIAKGAMALLGAMVFIVSLGYGAGLPLIRPYLLRYLGAVPASTVAWHVGMLGGVYLFALFVFAPLWGRLSDRHGRVLVLLIGFATFLVGSAATALAPSLGFVYAARLLAGAGAAAIVPTAQAYIADCSTTVDRSRRFVLLGSASFIGFLAGPAFGTWLAGPVMGAAVGEMGRMLNWPALAVAAAGAPLLLLAPLCLGRNHAIVAAPVPEGEGVAKDPRRHFVHASMLLALLASFAVGTFEVGFNLFGTQTLGLTTATMAAMFITCSLAMLAAQLMLLLSSVRRRVDQRWVAAAFAGSALALAFTSLVPDAGSLGLMIAVVATGAGMVGPVLSYELLERKADAPGALLGRQAAAGNLGQALGSMSAGSLFTFAPMAPFWTAAVILLLGAVLSMVWWGPTRLREIAAGKLAGARDSATAAVSSDLPAPQG
ncbi:MAG: MFS transporter [Pseudomonadota bacterium]|nr:MFS transporter [Pseudomonadota bacterium]